MLLKQGIADETHIFLRHLRLESPQFSYGQAHSEARAYIYLHLPSVLKEAGVSARPTGNKSQLTLNVASNRDSNAPFSSLCSVSRNVI